MKILDREINFNNSPFIIAEMSGNHNKSLENALKIVEVAARSGADAVKLQTYTPDTMTINSKASEFYISNPTSPWFGQTMYELYEKAQTPWSWHKQIFEHAAKLGILAFSSPFDESAVSFLETIDAPCYKIASFENTDIPLIKSVAATGKPIIISTGMATLAELDETVSVARNSGCNNLALLKCTSSYPAQPKDSNLITIPHLKKLFNCEVGLSDHTLGIGVAIAATVLGATIIEKHITLDRSEGGVDSSFSLEPHEFCQFVEEIRKAKEALGEVYYGATDSEKPARLRRRSVYIVEDIARGAPLTTKNTRCIRPGLGMAPKYYEKILGRAVKCDVKKGTPLDWDLIS